VGFITTGDTTEDVGSRKTGSVLKVRDAVVGDTKFAEAVEQIWSSIRPGAACNVVLRLAVHLYWSTDLRVQTGGGNRSSLS